MAKGRRRRQDLRVAGANTRLRYAPEERGLQALLGQAHDDYKTQLRVNAGTAASTIRSARQSRPAVKKIYNQAIKGVKNARSDVQRVYRQGGVGPQNIYEIASGREIGGELAGLRHDKAGARQQTYRDVAMARLGKAFANQSARQQYQDTRSQLKSRWSELQGEKRDFLINELDKRDQLHRQGAVTAKDRFNRQTQIKLARRRERLAAAKAKQAAADKKAKKGKKGWNPDTGAPRSGVKTATPVQVREMKDWVAQARNYLQKLRSPKGAEILRKQGLNPNDRQTLVKLALRKSGIKETALHLALDQELNGYVSTKYANYFRDVLGIDVGRMGMHTYQIRRPTTPRGGRPT